MCHFHFYSSCSIPLTLVSVRFFLELFSLSFAVLGMFNTPHDSNKMCWVLWSIIQYAVVKSRRNTCILSCDSLMVSEISSLIYDCFSGLTTCTCMQLYIHFWTCRLTVICFYIQSEQRPLSCKLSFIVITGATSRYLSYFDYGQKWPLNWRKPHKKTVER